MTPRQLDSLAARWRWRLGVRDGLFALGAAGVVAAATLAWVTPWAFLTLLTFVATLAAKLMRNRIFSLNAARIVRHLDRAYPDLEESASLWLRKPATLTLVERLQLRRIDTAIQWVIPEDPPPGLPPRGFLRTAGWCAAVGVALWGGVEGWTMAHGMRAPGVATATARTAVTTTANTPAAPVWPRVVGSALTVTPPAYTGRPVREVAGFNAEVEEGAGVAWSVTLDRPVREARLVFGSGNADLPLAPPVGGKGNVLSGTSTVTETGLYHLAAVLLDGTAWNPPELYSLKVIPDRPPTLRVVQPPDAHTVVEPTTPPPCVTVEVLAGDDYGVGEAHLVATVAKGSGEAVKFREQTLAFDPDPPADTDAPHGQRFVRTLDLGALGMEPGDELYFFVEAHDNRQPTPNRTRSETRFVVLRGPEEHRAASGKGVAGVNLVPPYFRSERQIIIDTEKLLADRLTISEHGFRERANDLGIDQQLLRLRYGQFIGEELEGSAVTDHTEVNLNPLQAAAPSGETGGGPHAAASVAQRFLQEHIEQDTGTGGDAPRAAPEKPLAAGEVRQPFVDSHDTQDAATLFDRDSKSTMKDALAAMWSAEGFLRTARPADALAPEHRALEILKDLQQSERAYVQHVGFEPEPLKIAERRLKGDASSVPASALDHDTLPPSDPAAGSVRAVLAAVAWDATPGVWTPDVLELFKRVEPVLTAAATRQPDVFLDGLQVLRRVRAGGTAENLKPLERALWKLLPPGSPLPSRTVESDPALADAYYKTLGNEEAAKP